MFIEGFGTGVAAKPAHGQEMKHVEPQDAGVKFEARCPQSRQFNAAGRYSRLDLLENIVIQTGLAVAIE